MIHLIAEIIILIKLFLRLFFIKNDKSLQPTKISYILNNNIALMFHLNLLFLSDNNTCESCMDGTKTMTNNQEDLEKKSCALSKNLGNIKRDI